MDHAHHDNDDLPVQLPDALGPYSVETEEERERKERKKKKRHKKPSKLNEGDDRRSPHDNVEVRKKKKKERHTDDGVVKKKKKKRRTPEEQLMREAARRKSRKQLADFDQAAGITKSSRARPRRRPEDPGLSEQQVRVPARMEDEGQADKGMTTLSPARQSSRQLDPNELDAAFGEPFQGPAPTYGVIQQEVNWETGEGLVWPDDNDVSVITPLTAFADEPSLREDVEDPFVPVTTSFSGMSPGADPGRPQWQPELEGEQEEEPGPEVDDPLSLLPGAHRVVASRYQAPVSRYSHDRSRRSSAPQARVRSGTSSLMSEKKRHSLPLGLYPIAETGEPPEKKKEKGALALFPVDETYDGTSTSKEKSQHRLSYSSTGESYAQFEAEDPIPGGTYIATRRISDKRRRAKERGEGPSYFRSSERYDDENLMADNYGRSFDMESQALGEDRLGAFAVRRAGASVSGDSTEGLIDHRADGINRPGDARQNTAPDENPEGSNKKSLCNKWFKLLVAFLLLAGIAVAIAVPLTVLNNDDSSSGFSESEVAARKEQLLAILEGVSDPAALSDESSPQYAAVEWMSSEDAISPLNNGILSGGIVELILQRYSLAVFYYSTTGDEWFSSDGWLDGQKEECSWQFVQCVEEDVVSIDTGPRNNLVGSLEPELKELKELRSLILRSNAISSISVDLGLLQSFVELDLSRNAIGGTIPSEIFELLSLQRLTLTDNSFTGTLSPLFTRLVDLTHLSIDTNDMSGLITTEFQVFSGITYLDISNNLFSGNFNSMFTGLNNLESLLLVNNRITGSIPPEIQLFTNLEFLDLARTTMQGSIPSEMGTLSNLRQLLLENIGLTGTIPTELGNLSSLESAYLDFNSFQGSVPTEMCALPELTDLRVDCYVECQCVSCGDECRRRAAVEFLDS